MKRIIGTAGVLVTLAAIAPNSLAAEPVAILARSADISTLSQALTTPARSLPPADRSTAELEVEAIEHTLALPDLANDFAGGCRHGAGSESIVDSKFHNFFRCQL